MPRGRGGKRGRGRPPRPQFFTRSEIVNKNIFIKKPVYLRDKDDDVQASRSSTPGIPRNADGDDNVSRSRSSSVTRSSLGQTPRKKLKKSKIVGASTSADQEYYYGSDFENLTDIEEGDGQDGNESSDSDSEQRSVYDADELLSDSELGSLPSSVGGGQDYVPVSRPPTPVPVWLQEREIPQLVLPPSSDDLVIPRKHILQTCAVYEVLRHFRTQILLSPFTLEDFGAALMAPEQSKLLSEVHFQMLRMVLREDEKQQVQFGPQDHKDSINSVLYMCDLVTWPETLRIYLHTRARGEQGIQRAVEILDSSEYPYVPFEDRLTVLQVLVDMVLVTPIVRYEFQREGPIVYDDHCRACHRLGDLLCCETCPATYHLECVDPPLKAVPDHDWQCDVCRKHQVKGVTDCVSDMEKNGAMSRQEVLGYDRHGRRYWFLCRRLFIEEPDAPESVVYYSTPAQYALLMSRLDRSDLEDALCMSLQELHYDIHRQMALTEEMTEQRLTKGATSYLQTDTEGDTAAAAAAGGGGDAPSSGSAEPGAAATDMTSAGDTDAGEEAKATPAPSAMVTRTKSGALPSRAADQQDSDADSDADDAKPAGPFRLGDASDRAYRRYQNQYTSNPLALNRQQQAEDKDKRRHMSHKFSLTQASEFEWADAPSGQIAGSRQQLRTTLRHTLQELVRRLPTALMHPSWPQLRRAWLAAVTGSTRPQDFARALTVISALVKPRLICPVWGEAITHVELQRVTAPEREERKKTDKREKREKDEEELAQLRVPFVKYHVKKVKHQVWKQRGEEYRIHGQTGWLWLSRTRRYRPAAAADLGLAAGPARVQLQVTDSDGVTSRSLWLPHAVYRRQLQRQTERDGPADRLLTVRLKPGSLEPEPDPEAEADTLQVIPPGPPEQTDDVIDVSAGLRSKRRVLFPRSARPARLDRLLSWRESLERRERGDTAPTAADSDSDDTKPVRRDGELSAAEARLALLTAQRCYSRACRDGHGCYAPTCLQAAALRRDPVRLPGPPETEIKQEADDELVTGRLQEKPAVKLERTDNGKIVKREPGERPRFAGISTEEPVRLEVIKPVQKRNYVRYPLFSKFRAGGRWSMLVLPTWEVRQLARKRGQKLVQGFNPAAKNNSSVWPYPCPRASFRTGWLYRTSRVRSIHAAGLQLRILWACIRWDDIDSRPQQVGPGEFQITTDTGMVRSLVLKHRDEGRFKERTMYYRRRVTILFDNPVIVEKEYTSSARSGLRKRRRVIESSENPSSAVTQEWVPEDELEIFEIKYYHEKVERLRQERQQAILQKRAALQSASSRSSSPAEHAADGNTEVLTPGRQITATANIVQTVAGPRVVIQGVPTQGLSQSQLHNLQQQVKAELAKGPMLTGLRDIHLTIPADVPDPAAAAAAAPAAVPTAGQSLLATATTATQRQMSLLSPRRAAECAAAAGSEPHDFTVTQEYIQQSINNALNSADLKPEIAEKLLQLRKKPAAGDGGGGPAAAAAARPAATAGRGEPPKKRPKTDRPPGAGRARARAERKSPNTRPSARLQQLQRRKEQLKKEILRKRLHMENQLQLEISKQLVAYRRAIQEQREGRARHQQQQLQRDRRHSSPRAVPVGRKSEDGRRKLEDGRRKSEDGRRKAEDGRKRKSSSSGRSPGVGRPAKKAKKEPKESPRDAKKLYCVCRRPYDPTKFYVGCDMCSNWYHGSCVGVSQRNSKKVKSFVCQQCQSAKENRELFCFCRTEYDESQFYIGCDTCEDWFHGRCVGILPSEGDEIDDYVCPRCEPGSRINGPNFRPLSDANYAELRRVFKQIKNNKSAWPFIEPVDPDEVPNYYKVIKEPMDLQTIENRLDSRHYGRLCDFTGDMIVVLDNCKYFNPPGTRLATCGQNLEAFFRAELKKLRAKI